MYFASIRTIARRLLKGSNRTMAELRIRDLDDDLHRALRHLAVERDTSLNKLVAELLQEAVDKLSERTKGKK